MLDKSEKDDHSGHNGRYVARLQLANVVALLGLLVTTISYGGKIVAQVATFAEQTNRNQEDIKLLVSTITDLSKLVVRLEVTTEERRRELDKIEIDLEKLSRVLNQPRN